MTKAGQERGEVSLEEPRCVFMPAPSLATVGTFKPFYRHGKMYRRTASQAVIRGKAPAQKMLEERPVLMAISGGKQAGQSRLPDMVANSASTYHSHPGVCTIIAAISWRPGGLVAGMLASKGSRSQHAQRQADAGLSPIALPGWPPLRYAGAPFARRTTSDDPLHFQRPK